MFAHLCQSQTTGTRKKPNDEMDSVTQKCAKYVHNVYCSAVTYYQGVVGSRAD